MTLSLADRSTKKQKVKILPISGHDPESQRSEMIKVKGWCLWEWEVSSNNHGCTKCTYVLSRINYSTIGQLTYLGEISVVGHLFETAPCIVYTDRQAWDVLNSF